MAYKSPLNGIRIIDFSWVGAGPITTKILAEFGAEVIRIESNSRPDLLRLSGPYKDSILGLNRSGYYNSRNPNKKSISLNMKHHYARNVAVKLIKTSDIIINNFTLGVMEKWNLDYKSLKEIKEDIIYVSMPLQGSTGPHKNFMGFGLVMNALVGFNYLSGFPEKVPYGTGTNYPDHVPNPTHTVFAIMAALRHKHKTGEGQYIEVAQTETALNTIPISIMAYANNGEIQKRVGNRHPVASPHGVYTVKGSSKWIAITVFNEKEWEGLLNVMGNPSWSKTGIFITIDDRLRNNDELDKRIEGFTSTQCGEELLDNLVRAGVPAGLVKDSKLAVTDTQLNYRNHWVYLDHPETGYSLYNSSPIKMSKTPARYDMPAPLLGQHTEEVMKHIVGLSNDEYLGFKEEGLFD